MVGIAHPAGVRVVCGRPLKLLLVSGEEAGAHGGLVVLVEHLAPPDLDGQLVVSLEEHAVLALRHIG